MVRSLRTAGRRSDASTRAVVAAVVVGTVVRLVWCAVAVRPHVGQHDPAAYVRLAQDLAAGHGYRATTGAPTAYYPVGYPAVLAAVWWLVTHTPLHDDPWWAAAALNVACAAAIVALVGVLGRRLGSPAAGAVAAWLVALHPNLVYNSAPALTEHVFLAALLTGLVLAGVGRWRPPRPVVALAAGAALGTAGLVRPVGLIAALVVLVTTAARSHRAGRIAAAGLLVGVLVVCVPWAVRNEARLGRATLATSTGDNLCIGNHPDATGAFGLPDACFADVPGLVGGRPEAARDATLTRRAVRWIVDDPLRQVGLVWDRTFWTMRSDHDGLRAVQSYESDPWLTTYHPGVERVLRGVADAWWWVLLALGLAGAARWMRSPRAGRGTVLAATAGLLVAVWPFFGDTRFHLPLVPLLALPAGDLAAAALRRGPVEADEHDDGQSAEDGAVGGVEGERPAEAGDRARDDLAGDDIGAGGCSEGGPDERETATDRR